MKSLELLAKMLSIIGLLGAILMGSSMANLFGPSNLLSSHSLAESSGAAVFSLWRWISPSHPIANQLPPIILGCGSIGSCWLFLQPKSLFPALLSYVSLLIFNNTFAVVSYGYYQFLQIGLAYILLANLFGTILKPEVHDEARGIIAKFLGAHVALAYCLAGLSKSVGPHWWSGESMWRALNSGFGSDTVLISATWLGNYPFVLKCMGIGVVLLECLYPLVYFRRLRTAIIGGAILMHIGIIVFQGLFLFGLTMIALNVFTFYSLKEEAPRYRADTPAAEAA